MRALSQAPPRAHSGDHHLVAAEGTGSQERDQENTGNGKGHMKTNWLVVFVPQIVLWAITIILTVQLYEVRNNLHALQNHMMDVAKILQTHNETNVGQNNNIKGLVEVAESQQRQISILIRK